MDKSNPPHLMLIYAVVLDAVHDIRMQVLHLHDLGPQQDVPQIGTSD